MKAVIFVVALVAACAGKPDAQECVTGITCPQGTKCAAVQPVCITNNCGDGVVQSTEKCDDGNILDGDGCAANCLSQEVCGDGVINSAAGELCDDGNTLGGDGCSMDCRSIEICGNKTVDVGEACDDGNTVSGDGCSGNCRSTEICGNGIVDINEKCDDGNVPGGCNDDCQGGTGCGDGAIDKDGQGNPLEECDDGNTNNQDDCTNTCKLAKCGDGIVETSGTVIEQCDPSVNFGETFGCNIDCTNAICGDGKINNARGEQCDDKNAVDADACKNDCKLNYCGDGVPGGPNEACDDAGNSTMCNANCTSTTCGDFFVNPMMGEDCDTGGVATATCDANCTVPRCGDGTTNTFVGEECDDMNLVDGDNCRNDCKLNVCGDGFRDTQTPNVEACDDGNILDENACPYGTPTCSLCNHNCTSVETLTGPVCGDGTTDSLFGENCDDHNTNACGTCDASCNQFASSAATGYIVAPAGAQLKDTDTFTINDGFGHTVTFEFDKNNDGVTTGNTAIQTGAGDSAATMQTRIKNAVQGSTLIITPSIVGLNLVGLVHTRKSSLGNQPITNNVNTSDFAVSGMSGGAGGNCAAAIGCSTDDDCASHNCMNNVCQ